MIKNLFFFLLSLSSIPICFGQEITDTIYYNRNSEICIKDSAEYYRITQKADSLFLITEYFTTGKMRRTCYSSTFGDSLCYFGEYKLYFKDGMLQVQNHYYNNKLQGKCTRYFKDGSVYSTGQFVENKPDGELYCYFKNQKVRRYENYVSGKLVEKKCYTETGQDTAYYPAFQPPVLKGKLTMNEYASRHVEYPEEALKNGITGTVRVIFTISTDGKISNIYSRDNVDPSLKKEAIRVVSKMKKWIPAKDDNGYITVKYTAKVVFKL